MSRYPISSAQRRRNRRKAEALREQMEQRVAGALERRRAHHAVALVAPPRTPRVIGD